MAQYDRIDWGEMRRNRRMKRFMYVIQAIVYVCSVWAILAWYDWKLIVILVLFGWANNIQMNLIKKR